MEKLFLSLKNILNSTDPEAMDDMTVEEECVIFFLKKYFELRGSTVHHVHNIQVTDGPNYGPVSTNVSLRFEAVSTNPDGEDKEIMSVFLKMPPMLPMSLDRVFQTELCFYSSLLPDMLDYFRHPIKGEYLPPLPSSVFIHTDLEDQNKSLIVLRDLVEEGFYSPKDRVLDKNELRSVLKALARFHADGLAFIKRNNIEKYTFIKEDTGRIKYAQKLIDQFFEPFLIYLEQFDSVRPAVVTLRELQSKGTILEVAFPHLYGKSNPAFLSICHRNLGNGNILLKCLDTCSSAHQVALVDWSHVSLSPFTMDVVHLIFSGCGTDVVADWSELMHEYYDHLKMFLKSVNIDRTNLDVDFEKFWSTVALSVKAEFIQESVLTPLTVLCAPLLAYNTELKDHELMNLFASENIEDDVIPALEMAMSLGLASQVEKTNPELFKDCARRGSLLTGRLVTRQESLKDPLPACLRRRRASLAPRSPRRSISREETDGDSGAGTPKSTNLSRRGSSDPDVLEALNKFEISRQKSNLRSAAAAVSVEEPAETLGTTLKMITKRRSLFEHASVFGYGTW